MNFPWDESFAVLLIKFKFFNSKKTFNINKQKSAKSSIKSLAVLINTDMLLRILISLNLSNLFGYKLFIIPIKN